MGNYQEIEDTAETGKPYDYGKSIIENTTNNKYVDLINTVSPKAMVQTGWYNECNRLGDNTSIQYSNTNSLLGMYVVGAIRLQNCASGVDSRNYTFRPAIWN